MTQLTLIPSNTAAPVTNDKSTELSKLLKEHLKNRPVEDSSHKRDTEIAHMQNEAAVAEKNIRKLTQQIEERQRDRAGLKNDRQEKYEAMNSANNVLQGKKQEKDKVFQRLKRTRAGANALRVGRSGKESFRSIKELDAAVRETERRMQTEVLSLREEKDMIRRLGEYRKMRPEVQKMQTQYEALDDYKESNKEQEEADAREYKMLKAEVEKAYQFQQTQYEVFRQAMEADQELNDEISAAIQKRRDLYEAQKQTRDAIVTRRRGFQQSARRVQQWEQQKRRLGDDIQRAMRAEQRREREGRITRVREERRAREQEYRLEQEEAAQEQASLEAKEDEPADQLGEPRATKTCSAPRPRAPRRVYVPRSRDVVESQKNQLAIIETYVRTLAPQTAPGSATVSVAAPGPTESRKGIFKPSRADEAPASLTDDLFKSTKKGKKSKRKRTKKVKQTLLVQAHTPPTVKSSMEMLGGWLSEKSCPLSLTLPVRASEAPRCLENLDKVRAWIQQYPESQRRAAEQAETDEKEDAPNAEEEDQTPGEVLVADPTERTTEDAEPASDAEEVEQDKPVGQAEETVAVDDQTAAQPETDHQEADAEPDSLDASATQEDQDTLAVADNVVETQAEQATDNDERESFDFYM